MKFSTHRITKDMTFRPLEVETSELLNTYLKGVVAESLGDMRVRFTSDLSDCFLHDTDLYKQYKGVAGVCLEHCLGDPETVEVLTADDIFESICDPFRDRFSSEMNGLADMFEGLAQRCKADAKELDEI